MPKKKDAQPESSYTWLHSPGGGPVLAAESRDSRRVRSDEDAMRVLREVVRQIGLPAALRLLSEVAAEGAGAGAKKGGKR